MKTKPIFSASEEIGIKAISNNIPDLMKQFRFKKYLKTIFSTLIIYSVFLAVGYLASILFNSLQNIYSNAMLLSYGFLFGTLYLKYRYENN